ncbi:hypothetical protein B0T17DRAFT_296182 [Bombardia bombarda]|uniref:Uncharacterized protein n=1 Tax=Bombardia bombarda TaxID=252184 RepID=A0AA40C1K6_9PEZI|nr:hypothetical protein B0T17DRAFT_296182 [Bombardia bombarda]
MRFSPATLLLAPALVSANNIFFSNGEDAWLGDRAPSADIRLLSLSPTLAEERDLTFRLDVLESEEACGYANITINGAPLADRHRGVLTLDHGVIVLANWRFECMIWRGVESEQLMFLDIESVNDQAVSDMGFAIRFRQSEPMWLTDIQGQASIITPNSKTNDDDIPLDDGPFLDEDEDDEYEYEDEDGEEGSKLEQALAEIASLQAQVEDLMDELSFTHEQMAELIERREREQRVRGCDSVRCYIKAITNKFSGHRLPADGEFHITSVLDPSDTDAEGGPHKGHWPPKFRFPHHGHGNHTHGNHTHGNHTFPHRPPFWCRLPRHPPFKHRPPFGRHPPRITSLLMASLLMASLLMASLLMASIPTIIPLTINLLTAKAL